MLGLPVQRCSGHHCTSKGTTDTLVTSDLLHLTPTQQWFVTRRDAQLHALICLTFSLLMRSLRVATSRVGRGVRAGLSRRNPSNSCCTTCICSLAVACRCCPAATSLCEAAKSPFRALTSSYIQAAPIQLSTTAEWKSGTASCGYLVHICGQTTAA